MTLKQKRELVFTFIDLGMGLYEAYLCSSCTIEETELLDTDENFQREVKTKYALMEVNLLRKHDTAIDIAALKGNASPIQWRLDKLNPKKYGSKEIEAIKDNISELNVNLIGVDVDKDSQS